jgi:putative selenium metabolism hydrolase
MAPVWNKIDRNGLSACAQRLVQTPSFSGQEAAVAQLLAEELRAVGFRVTIDEMGNVIGLLGSGQGPVLLYNGHMDTVGLGDCDLWERDPLGGEVHRGVLYGRGAADMKGALAAMVYGGKALAESGQVLNGTLAVVAVVQEEPCEGLAMRHVIEQTGVRPDWVVLGEATSLQLSRGQRGRVAFEVNIHGRSCHAAAPRLGVNAIYQATRLVMGLELLAPQLNGDSFLGQGTLAVTEIHSAAGSRNAVPDRCTLLVDRRLTIGETETKALAEIKRVLTREGLDATIAVPTERLTSYTGFISEARQVFPFWLTPENEPLLVTAAGAIEANLGYLPRLGRWEFSTDGVYTAGVAGIPTIGFGPGEERFAHTTDEQVRLQDLQAAAQVYADLAVRMLK